MAVVLMTAAQSGAGANLTPNAFLEKVFITALRSKMVATRLGQPSSMPEGNGLVVRWQYFSSPGANVTASEGLDATTTYDYTTTTASATLAEYNGFTKMSRLMLKSALSGTIQEVVKGNAYQAALSMETLVLRIASGGVNATTTTVDAGASLTADALRQGVQKLVINNAAPHRLTPGGAFYALIASGEAAYDMMGEGAPAWFQVKSGDYQSALISPFEDTPATAALYGAIVKISNNIPRWTTTTPDNDLNVLIADESFGVAALDTNVMQPAVIVTTPDQMLSSPTRTFGTVGWRVFFGSILFDNNRVVQVSSDATGT